jgi:hypothetical protein
MQTKTCLFRLPPQRHVRAQDKYASQPSLARQPRQARQRAALTESTYDDAFRRNSVLLDFRGDECVDEFDGGEKTGFVFGTFEDVETEDVEPVFYK